MLRMFLVEFTSARFDECNVTSENVMLFCKGKKDFFVIKITICAVWMKEQGISFATKTIVGSVISRIGIIFVKSKRIHKNSSV